MSKRMQVVVQQARIGYPQHLATAFFCRAQCMIFEKSKREQGVSLCLLHLLHTRVPNSTRERLAQSQLLVGSNRSPVFL